MAVTSKDISSKSEWENFILKTESNFLQSWNWGQFSAKVSRPSFFRGYYRDNRLIGVCLFVLEDARRGRYLTAPDGPVIDWEDKELIQAWKEDAKRLGKQNKCVFVRVLPPLRQTRRAKRIFKDLGFRPAMMHLHAEHTHLLDLTKELGELKANFRKNTRYEIKRAAKRGIKITKSTNPEDIKQFYDIQLKTAKRHSFVPYSYPYLYEQFKQFNEDGQVALYTAKKDDQIIAQAFIIFYNKEAAYHYGASTELGRKEPGAYLIQWQAIQDAKARGLKRYNFWGVVDPEDTKHKFYGVSVFKRGFRGEDFKHLPTQDLVISKFRYPLTYVVEYIRKKVRKL